MVDGLAVVDKPAGMTSHDVVSRCRKLFGQKRVGHAGTLDPDATGVLLVGLGRATRLLHFMSGLDKTYEADIVLGAATDTLDAAGQVTQRFDMSAVTLAQAQKVARELTGAIMQVPPMVSAVKVGGQRLHRLARAGVEVERQPRPVVVQEFAIESLEGSVLRTRIACSSGTYIRVLADDLGRGLGGGAHVGRLRRTSVGPWSSTDAVPLDQLTPDRVKPPVEALPWLTAVTVPALVAQDVAHGKVLDLDRLAAAGAGPWRVIGPGGDLLAIYIRYGEGQAKPAVVLAPAS